MEARMMPPRTATPRMILMAIKDLYLRNFNVDEIIEPPNFISVAIIAIITTLAPPDRIWTRMRALQPHEWWFSTVYTVTVGVL